MWGGFKIDFDDQRADLLRDRRKSRCWIDDSRCADYKEEVADPQGLITAAQVFLPERFPKPDDMRPEQCMAQLARRQDGKRDLQVFRDDATARTANLPDVAVNFGEAL